jgi:ABC-type Mn2+/Zn2+ transport system ATPase subunit
MLAIRNLTFTLEGKRLFDDASALIPTGHKVGFVGRNGTGQTTLFRLIRGELTPDSREIEVPRRACVVRATSRPAYARAQADHPAHLAVAHRATVGLGPASDGDLVPRHGAGVLASGRAHSSAGSAPQSGIPGYPAERPLGEDRVIDPAGLQTTIFQ